MGSGGAKLRVLSGVAAVAVAISSAAKADDVLRKAPLSSRSWSWTGFYVGANIGGSVGSVGSNDAVTVPPSNILPPLSSQYLTASSNRALAGVIGGGQIGYNWQFGSWLLGAEADWQWSDQRDTLATTANNFLASTITVAYTDEVRIKALGTARGRVGWAQDNWLWYVTGGVAWAKIESNYVVNSYFAGTSASPTMASFATTKTGWTIGGGVETALSGTNWSTKLEYLYVDLGSTTNVLPFTYATGSRTLTSSNNIHDHIIRGGINYRF